MPHGPSASNNKQTIPMPHNPTQSVATIEGTPSKKTQNLGDSDKNQGTSRNTPIPIVTCDFASDISTSEAGAENDYEFNKDTLKVTVSDSKGKATSTTTMLSFGSKTATSSTTLTTNASPVPGRNRALSIGVDTDMVSEFDPSSSDSGVVSRCAVVKPLKFRLCQPIFGKKSSKPHKDNHHHCRNGGEHKKHHKKKKHAKTISDETDPAIPKPKIRDPEKEKRRIARKKEKRATLILGLIMGSFLACWIPFFVLYILTPLCGSSCEVPEFVFSVSFWLGYLNSMLNPLIYTIFNRDFRNAFRRILFK